MILQMFSIYDDKAEAFHLPFFCHTPAVAIRMAVQAATDPEREYCIHAADYTLFHSGEWDDSTATATNFASGINLGNLHTLRPSMGELAEVVREADAEAPERTN